MAIVLGPADAMQECGRGDGFLGSASTIAMLTLLVVHRTTTACSPAAVRISRLIRSEGPCRWVSVLSTCRSAVRTRRVAPKATSTLALDESLECFTHDRRRFDEAGVIPSLLSNASSRASAVRTPLSKHDYSVI